MRICVLVTAAAIALSGCASGPQRGAVQFFPVNNEANAIGLLNGEYVTNGVGNGTINTQMPDGELLTGQYSIVQGGTVGFGNIYASVYGSGGAASGFATRRSGTVERGSPGMASLYGNKGTSMQCEFYNDNVTHHGYGGCRTSKGAEFRLQF